MSPTEFEPTIPARERPQTDGSDRATIVIGFGKKSNYLKFLVQVRSRDRIVYSASSLRAGGSGFLIPVGVRDFSPFQNFLTESGAHPASYSKVTEVLS
jgi:hypothetical protein